MVEDEGKGSLRGKGKEKERVERPGFGVEI